MLVLGVSIHLLPLSALVTLNVGISDLNRQPLTNFCVRVSMATLVIGIRPRRPYLVLLQCLGPNFVSGYWVAPDWGRTWRLLSISTLRPSPELSSGPHFPIAVLVRIPRPVCFVHPRMTSGSNRLSIHKKVAHSKPPSLSCNDLLPVPRSSGGISRSCHGFAG